MNKRIIEVESYQEAKDLKQYLELNFIPCSIGQHTPNAIIDADEKTIYYVSFPSEYSDKYEKAKQKNVPSKVFRIEEVFSTHKSFIAKYFLILYSLIVSLFCLKFYYSSNHGNFEKNFKTEWSLDNKTFNVIRKKTNKLFSSYKDRNFDRNWEKVYQFHKGIKISEAIDSNENGIYEEFLEFDLNGNNISRHIDFDQDGLTDTVKMFLENNIRLTLIDQDKNGHLELFKKKDMSNR